MSLLRICATLILAGTIIAAGIHHGFAQERRHETLTNRLVVFAAASMKTALDDINKAYGAKTGTTVIASYAASSVLARQLAQAAPANIFISADSGWMDYAARAGAINVSSRLNLLGNQLVLIAPKDSSLDHTFITNGFDLAKLAGAGRIVTGNVESVPAGKYAKAALQKLGAWDAAQDKFAMADNVRVALALVARGEATLGIVYATDAKAEPDVKIIGTFPASSHPPIVYPVAATATFSPESKNYLNFLRSQAALSIFKHYGFSILLSPTTETRDTH